MKIKIEVKECEGTEKELVQKKVRDFLLENFQKGNEAKVEIE